MTPAVCDTLVKLLSSLSPAVWDTLVKLLPPILIIVGWYVVVSVQALQSRRRIIREELATLRTMVGELKDAAIKFHTQSPSEDLRRNIMAQLKEIARRADLLPRIAKTNWIMLDAIPKKRLPKPTSYIIALRQAVTTHHFDSLIENLPQPALSLDSDQILQIESEHHNFLAYLDETMIAALD